MATTTVSSVIPTEPYVKPRKKTNYWIIAIIVAILIIIVIIVIIVVATRTTSTSTIFGTASRVPTAVQQSTVVSGTDTLAVSGDVVYIASPTAQLNLTIPASFNNPRGTIIGIKNESTTASIVLVPESGVNIVSGVGVLNIPPRVYAQYIATDTNRYLRLT